MPLPPTLALSAVGDGQIALTYTPPVADYADGLIEFDDGVTLDTEATTIAGTYTITGLDNGTTYTFTAKARDALGDWSARSLAVVVIPTSTALTGRVLGETKLVLEALALGGAGQSQVFLGRKPKPGPQSKRISINVYIGDLADSSRPGTTGHTFLEVPVHVHVTFKKQDKSTGESQTELMGDYLLQMKEALQQLRPDDLSAAITGFFTTTAQVEDLDTETDSTNSEAAGLDPSIEGYLTVMWQFWRAS